MPEKPNVPLTVEIGSPSKHHGKERNVESFDVSASTGVPTQLLDFHDFIEESEAIKGILSKFETVDKQTEGRVTYSLFKPIAEDLSNNILKENDIHEIFEIFQIAEGFDYHKFLEQISKTMPVIEYGANSQLLFLDFAGIVLEDKDRVFATMKREDQQQQQLYDWIEQIMPKLEQYDEIKYQLSIANDEIDKLQEELKLERNKRRMQQDHYEAEEKSLSKIIERMSNRNDGSEVESPVDALLPAVSPLMEESNRNLRKDILMYQNQAEELAREKDKLTLSLSQAQADLQQLKLDHEHERGLRQRLESNLKEAREEHARRKESLHQEINTLRGENKELEHELNKLQLRLQFQSGTLHNIDEKPDLAIVDGEKIGSPPTSYSKLTRVLYEDAEQSDISSPTNGKREVQTGLPRMDSVSTAGYNSENFDDVDHLLRPEITEMTLLAKVGSKASLTPKLWENHRRRLSQMSKAKRNSLSMRKLQRTRSMVKRTRSSINWNSGEPPSSPSFRARLSDRTLYGSANNDEVMRAINQLRSDFAKHEILLLERQDSEDKNGDRQKPNVTNGAFNLSSLLGKLDEIAQKADQSIEMQQKAERNGTAVDKMQDEIIAFLSDEQKEMLDKITQMQKDSVEKDEKLRETLERLENAQKQIIAQNEKIENMSNVDEMQNELMKWISEEQKSVKKFIADQKEEESSKNKSDGKIRETLERLEQAQKQIIEQNEKLKDMKNVDEMQNELMKWISEEQKAIKQYIENQNTRREGAGAGPEIDLLKNLELKLDQTLSNQQAAEQNGTKVDKMQDEIIAFLSDEQKEILEKIAEMQKKSSSKDEMMSETLARLEAAQKQILDQKKQLEERNGVDEMQNELMKWMADEQKILLQKVEALSNQKEAISPNDSLLEKISTNQSLILKQMTSRRGSIESVGSSLETDILRRLEEKLDATLLQKEAVEPSESNQVDIKAFIAEQQKTIAAELQKASSNKGPDSDTLKRLEEKIDSALKNQEEAESKGTKVDKMQDEIIAFLSEEQKEILEKMQEIQRESQSKDVALKGALESLMNAQTEISEQQEWVRKIRETDTEQSTLMKAMSEEQKILLAKIEALQGTNKDAPSKENSDPGLMRRVEEKLERITKLQENAHTSGTDVDKVQNELIQFMQGEQKKLLDQMAKMQREAEEKDMQIKETLGRLETTQKELLKQKEDMEDMRKVDVLQNELMQWMGEEQEALLKRVEAIQTANLNDGGGSQLLEQIFQEQKAILEKVHSIQSGSEDVSTQLLERMCDEQKKILSKVENLQKDAERADEAERDNSLIKEIKSEQKEILAMVSALQKQQVNSPEDFERHRRRSSAADVLKQMAQEQKIMLEKIDELQTINKDLTISLSMPESPHTPRTSLEPSNQRSMSWSLTEAPNGIKTRPVRKNPEDLIKKYLQKERKSRREEQAIFYKNLQSNHETHMDEYKGMFEDLKEKVEARVTLYEKLLQSRRDSELALKKQLAKFQSENETLKESLNNGASTGKKLNPLRAQELQERVKNLVGENELMQSQMKALKKSVKNVQNQLEVSEQDKEEAEKQVERLRRKLKSQADELAQELKENDQLANKLKDLQATLETRVQEAEKEIKEKMEEQKKAHENMRQRMENELEAVYDKNELLQSQMKKSEEVWPRLESLLAGNEELKKKDEQRRQEVQDLQKTMQKEVDEVRESKRKLEDEMQSKIMREKDVNGKLERELGKLNEDLAEKREKELHLLKEIESLKLGHVSHASEKIQNLLRQKASLEETARELERALRKKDHTIQAMESAIDELERQLSTSRNSRSDPREMQKSNENLKFVKEELKKKDKELMVMQNAVHQLEERLKDQRMVNQEHAAAKHQDQQLIERFQRARKHAERAEKERDFANHGLEEAKREMQKQKRIVDAMKQQLRESQIRESSIPTQRVQEMERHTQETERRAQEMERRLQQTVQDLQIEKMKNRQLREKEKSRIERPPPHQEIELLKQISNQLRAQLKDREAQIQEMFHRYEMDKEKWQKDRSALQQERGGNLLRKHQANHAHRELQNKAQGLEEKIREQQREIARLEEDLSEAEKNKGPQRLNWDKIPMKVLRVLDNFDKNFDPSILCVTCRSRYIQMRAKQVENLIKKAATARRESISDSSEVRRMINVPLPKRKTSPKRRFLPTPNLRPKMSSKPSFSPTSKTSIPSNNKASVLSNNKTSISSNNKSSTSSNDVKRPLPSIADKSKTSDRFRKILGKRRQSTSDRRRKSLSPSSQLLTSKGPSTATSPASALSAASSRGPLAAKKVPTESSFLWNERRRKQYNRPSPFPDLTTPKRT